MSRVMTALSIVAVICVAGFEVQQVAHACQCMCYAISGLPDNFDVDVSGDCDRDFQYTFKVHFATDDNSCGSGIGGYGTAYGAGPSDNVQGHGITPATFTIAGAGHTETFTVSGNLADDNCDGVSATVVRDANYDCVADSAETSVPIYHDDTNCGTGSCL